MKTAFCSTSKDRWLPAGLLVLAAAAVDCSKSPASDAPPASSASAAASSSSKIAPSASAPAAAAGAPAAWTGAYTAKVGPVEPPKNANEKTWTQDPGSAAVGNGTVELSISEPRGDVTGEAKGALGEMIVAGTFDGRELRANLAPKNPRADGAMTGFMLLTSETPSAGPLKGSMRVSGRDARVVREASVELSKK